MKCKDRIFRDETTKKRNLTRESEVSNQEAGEVSEL